MTQVQDTVNILVEHYTGQEEGEDGEPYFVASCKELWFVTEATTFEKLLDNVKECLALALEDVDTVVEYNVTPDPRVRFVMEWPHAKIA